MTNLDIAHQRLHNQHISGTPFEKPEEVVRWLGAVQAQDYLAAQWALGLRLHGFIDADIDQAFAAGTILRTHVMRPTWHFVLPEDIRWMLELTAPRVKKLMAYYDRSLEVDNKLIAHSNTVLAKALEGGKQLTRSQLVPILSQAGIDTTNLQRFGNMMMHAELDAVICSGARRGKQFTYALLDERAPQAKMLNRDEALAELAKRYFTSHGPATVKDFVWWSGLTVADANAGLELVGSQLLHEKVDNQTYWFADSASPARSKDAYLLPCYDEYTVAYADRSALFDKQHKSKLDSRANVLFNYAIVVDSQVVGTWKRRFSKGLVAIALNPFIPLNAEQSEAVHAAAQHYGEFLGLSVVQSKEPNP